MICFTPGFHIEWTIAQIPKFNAPMMLPDYCIITNLRGEVKCRQDDVGLVPRLLGLAPEPDHNPWVPRSSRGKTE
jgi:hypothetical protein